jgi:predicted nucleic acid-binding protein
VTWLLDTNIFIPALNGRPSVRARLNEAAKNGEVVTSVLVLGELLHGAQCSKRSAENLRAVEQELSGIRILPVTVSVSRRFANLKTALRLQACRTCVHICSECSGAQQCAPASASSIANLAGPERSIARGPQSARFHGDRMRRPATA